MNNYTQGNNDKRYYYIDKSGNINNKNLNSFLRDKFTTPAISAFIGVFIIMGVTGLLNFGTIPLALILGAAISFGIWNFYINPIKQKMLQKFKGTIFVRQFGIDEEEIELTKKNGDLLTFRAKQSNDEYLKKLQEKIEVIARYLKKNTGYVKWVKDTNGIETDILELELFDKITGKSFPNIPYIMQKKTIYETGNINSYKVVSVEDNQIDFELRKGQSNNVSEISNAIPSLANFLLKNNGVTLEDEDKPGIITIRFYSKEEQENVMEIENENLRNQIILSLSGIKNYDIENASVKEINFRLRAGKQNNVNELQSAIPSLVDFFGKFSGLVDSSAGAGKAKIKFKNKLPTKNDRLPMIETLNVFSNKSLYLGVKDPANKDYARTQPNDEQKGKLNGHLILVGASGSGKSFGFNIIAQNWINPETYKEIGNIYILNLKGSADYNVYKHLDKVKYASTNKAEAYELVKEVYERMETKYTYNSLHGHENYKGQKDLFIVDEIQTLQEWEESTRDPEERGMVSEMITMFDGLGAKARAANISLLVILQKALVSNLPGGSAFRDNLRHRIGLKNNSMTLLFDEQEMLKFGIDGDKLTQGQFVYKDNLLGESSITEGFIQGLNTPYTKLFMDEDRKKVEKNELFTRLFGEIVESGEDKKLYRKLGKFLDKTTIKNLIAKVTRDKHINSLNEKDLINYGEEYKIDFDMFDSKEYDTKYDYVIDKMDTLNEGYTKTILDELKKDKDLKAFFKEYYPNEDFDKFDPKSDEEIVELVKDMGISKSKDSQGDRETERELEKIRIISETEKLTTDKQIEKLRRGEFDHLVGSLSTQQTETEEDYTEEEELEDIEHLGEDYMELYGEVKHELVLFKPDSDDIERYAKLGSERVQELVEGRDFELMTELEEVEEWYNESKENGDIIDVETFDIPTVPEMSEEDTLLLECFEDQMGDFFKEDKQEEDDLLAGL